MNRRTWWVVVIGALVAASCSSGSSTIASVDSTDIPTTAFETMHPAPDDLTDDERVGSVLVLILVEAFGVWAESELGITAPPADIEAAYTERIEAFEGRGDLSATLESLNQTDERIRLEAQLDVLRDTISEHLVRSESATFDLVAAEEAYLLANAEVCIRQMQFDDVADVDVALKRLSDGESFDAIARDISIDPFVARDEGVGAGGDLGCSAPSALPAGLDVASLTSVVDEPTGPVASSIGVHVVEVYDRTEPDLEAEHGAVIDLAVEAQGPGLFRLWAVDVLRSIDVRVDESVGRWGILPETDPVPTVVPEYRFDDILTNQT